MQLLECIDPKARQCWHGKGKVDIQMCFKILLLRLGHDLTEHFSHVVRRQQRQLHRPQTPLKTQRRHLARRQVQVGSTGPHCQRQQFSHIHETPQRPPSR
ncbi:hypothetical protein D3C76_926500 [compost metagenome]